VFGNEDVEVCGFLFDSGRLSKKITLDFSIGSANCNN